MVLLYIKLYARRHYARVFFVLKFPSERSEGNIFCFTYLGNQILNAAFAAAASVKAVRLLLLILNARVS